MKLISKVVEDIFYEYNFNLNYIRNKTSLKNNYFIINNLLHYELIERNYLENSY